MNKQNSKKLKKLNINPKKKCLKHSELVTVAAEAAAVGAVMAVAGSAAVGAASGISLMNYNPSEVMLMSGLISAGLSSGANIMLQQDTHTKTTKRQNLALFTAGLAATALSTGMGVGVGVGAHKLTTAIIDKINPQYQIEQTVEVEPSPVIDEIQVEK